MESLIETLLAYCEARQAIRIVYNGGSHPGLPRDVVPRLLQDGKLIAVDLQSHISKSYFLEKISSALPIEGPLLPLVAQPPKIPSIPSFDTFADYCEHFRELIDSLRMHVTENDAILGLATYFKNGKPRSNHYVAISFQQRFSDEELLLRRQGIEITHVQTHRERPWAVYTQRDSNQCKNFGALHSAFEHFVEELKRIRASDPVV